MLNPQFRKDIIPGDNHPYTLVLPSQQCLSYIVSEKAILDYDSDQYQRRTYVEPGEPRAVNVADAGQSQNADENNAIAQVGADSVIHLTHIVIRGESLRDIAKKYNVSSTDIKRWNNLRRGKVKEGEKLVINQYRRKLDGASVTPTGKSTVTAKKQTAEPKSKTTASSRKKRDNKPSTKSYTVKSGDNLEKIARRNGTTVEAIRKANGMSKGTTRINPGQKLKIPTSGSKSKVSSSRKSSGKKKSKSRRRRR